MKLGFIGIGKIASAIVEGLCTSGVADLQIFLSPRNEKLSSLLDSKYPSVRRLANNQEVLDQSDVVVIALRPAVSVEVLRGLSFSSHHTVVSLIPLLKYADLNAVV